MIMLKLLKASESQRVDGTDMHGIYRHDYTHADKDDRVRGLTHSLTHARTHARRARRRSVCKDASFLPSQIAVPFVC